MSVLIPLKAKYRGGQIGHHTATPGQKRSAPRKRHRQAQRLAADRAEAARLGITFWELRFVRALKWKQVNSTGAPKNPRGATPRRPPDRKYSLYW